MSIDDMIEVLQAAKAGKEIQRYCVDTWVDNASITDALFRMQYRVKRSAQMTDHQLAESFRRVARDIFDKSDLYKEQNCAVVRAISREADRLSPKREPREWWISLDARYAYDGPTPGAVHVREVLE